MPSWKIAGEHFTLQNIGERIAAIVGALYNPLLPFPFRLCWTEKTFQGQGVYVSKLSAGLPPPERLRLKPERRVNGTESLNPLPSEHSPQATAHLSSARN